MGKRKWVEKADVADAVHGLWISKSQRKAILYKLTTRLYSDETLRDWYEKFSKALDLQKELLERHAMAAVHSEEVVRLADHLHGEGLRKQRRVVAAKILRTLIKDEAKLKVPADLSREAVEKCL